MKKVVISVRGGVAEVVDDLSDEDVQVEIRDYDVEGCCEDRLAEDEEGEMYIFR